MPHRLCLFACCLALLLGSSLSAAELPAWQAPDGSTEISSRFQVDGRSFHIYVPTFTENDELDLLVWCHPGDGKSQPEFKWWQQQAGFKDGKTVLLCPQAKQRGWMSKNDDAFVSGLLRSLVKQLPIAQDRIVLGGHSAGAFYTYDYGLRNQRSFAALLPAAGFAANKIPRPDRKAAPQICIYHSKNDQVIPWDSMLKTKSTLERLGYRVDLTEDSVQHNIYPKLWERYRDLRTELRQAGDEDDQKKPGKQ